MAARLYGRRQLQRRAAGKRNGPPVGLHTMRRHDVPDRISILAPECVEIGIGSLRRAGPGCETRIEIAEWMGGTSQQEDMHRTQQEVRKLLVWVEATEQPGALPDP